MLGDVLDGMAAVVTTVLVSLLLLETLLDFGFCDQKNDPLEQFDYTDFRVEGWSTTTRNVEEQ